MKNRSNEIRTNEIRIRQELPVRFIPTNNFKWPLSNPESLESLTATKFMSCAELWSLDSFPRPLILSALPFSSFVQKLIRDYFPRINVIRGQEN